MRYTYSYTFYKHSPLASFLNRMQRVPFAALFLGMLPAFPFYIIGNNFENNFLMILSGVITIIDTILIMTINTDKIARKAFLKKYGEKLRDDLYFFIINITLTHSISILETEIIELIDQILIQIKKEVKTDIIDIINVMIFNFFDEKGIELNEEQSDTIYQEQINETVD